MFHVVFQISVAVIVHNGHDDENHPFLAFLFQITHPRLKQKEEGESFRCSFKGDRDVVSFLTCLFVGQAM